MPKTKSRSLPIIAGLLAMTVYPASAGVDDSENSPPKQVLMAIESAKIDDNLDVKVLSFNAPPRCTIDNAEVVGTIEHSGIVRVQLEGNDPDDKACRGWASARVEVVGSVWVVQDNLRAGDELSGAIIQEKQRIEPGRRPLRRVGSEHVAARRLGPGSILKEGDIRADGPRPGQNVKVLVISGSLRLEQQGRLVSCGRNRTCAVLPSGQRVEGELEDGRMVVEVRR